MRLLPPIKETPEDYDAIEEEIMGLLTREFYRPLLSELGLSSKTLKNSSDDLLRAIQSGRITFSRGRFTGKLNSTLSRELRRLGAKWDRKQGSFSIPQSKLSIEVKQAISLSESAFTKTVDNIVRKLTGVDTKEIAEKLDLNRLFDRTIFRVNKKIEESITISPKMTAEQRERISSEYTENMQLHIQEWADKEIVELREKVEKRSLEGQRYEGLVDEIQKSYGVARSKAKFLARQETSLMMTKVKQTRYQEAGVHEYKWRCVAGSGEHPVRPMHKIHDGKVFSWNNPPIVDENGNRKNPGQDYNCRCVAIPLVRT